MKKSARLGLALIYCVLLNSGTAFAQAPKTSPFDGMSAIEVQVAVARQRKAANSASSEFSPETPNGAASGLDFLTCNLVETKGRELHEGEFPIPGDPLPGEATALIEFNGYAHSAQFRLVDEAGLPLENISLDPPPGQTISSSYLGTFNVPNQPFRIAASGLGLDDQAFDISCDRLYSPQTIEVRFDVENSVVSAGQNELTAVVTNHGPAKTFLISAASDLGIAVFTNPVELELAQDESGTFTVSLVVPGISSGVLDIVITAFATSETEENLTNQASSRIRIERFEQMFWDNFE